MNKSTSNSYGGVGNLAPEIFTLLLPNVALPLLGLSGSYLAWLIFLIVGTITYSIIGKNAWYFQLIESGVEKNEARKIASAKYGQELFPNNKVSESLMISAKSWKTWALVLIYFATFGGFVIPPVMASFIDKTGVNLNGFSRGFLVFSALAIMSLIILGIFRMGSKNSAVTSKA